MNKGLNSEHILLKLCESFFSITNGQLVCKMAQAQMCLSAEQMSFLQQKCTCKMW
jgi:hypothetical protein